MVSHSTSAVPKAIVLVIDDEAILRMAAIDLVEDAGMEAIEAANADEAIAILETRSDVRIIVTDIEMPLGSINGLQIGGSRTQALASDRNHRDVRPL